MKLVKKKFGKMSQLIFQFMINKKLFYRNKIVLNL